MERIPPQVLILLGISGATGLGSVVIGDRPGAMASPPPPGRRAGPGTLSPMEPA